MSPNPTCNDAPAARSAGEPGDDTSPALSEDEETLGDALRRVRRVYFSVPDAEAPDADLGDDAPAAVARPARSEPSPKLSPMIKDPAP